MSPSEPIASNTPRAKRAAVRVRLQDTAGQPVPDATVDALLISGDRVVGTVPLRPDDPARGTYVGKTPPLDSGHYRVGVRASGFDSSALRATTPIWVGDRDAGEFAKVSVNVNALTALTEAGDGRFVHESSADMLLDEIRPLSTGTIVETDYAIWQSFWWFATIMVMLSAEWLLRKRAGLV